MESSVTAGAQHKPPRHGGMSQLSHHVDSQVGSVFTLCISLCSALNNNFFRMGSRTPIAITSTAMVMHVAVKELKMKSPVELDELKLLISITIIRSVHLFGKCMRVNRLVRKMWAIVTREINKTVHRLWPQLLESSWRQQRPKLPPGGRIVWIDQVVVEHWMARDRRRSGPKIGYFSSCVIWNTWSPLQNGVSQTQRDIHLLPKPDCWQLTSSWSSPHPFWIVRRSKHFSHFSR